jgi:hypothetical protein
MKGLTFFLMVAVLSAAAGTNPPVASGFPQGFRCDSVADTLLEQHQSLEGLESRYRLVFVKRDSVRTAARTLTGYLYLWRTSPRDSNAKGQKPPASDAARSFYFGTTDLNLEAADADFTGFWRKVHNPKRSDLDPIHPPILGIVHRGSDVNKPWLLFWLAIGTLMNRRDGGGGLDGMGVVLDVKRIDSRGFAGIWDRGGIVQTGRGYFCAYRDPVEKPSGP